MLSEENPCKGCTFETGRYVGCHSNCEKHKEWKKKCDEVRDIRLKKALSTPEIPRQMKKHVWRTMKDKK